LVYPALLACVATGVVIFLMVYFIPQFKQMFDEFGGRLPLLTQIIIAISDGLFRYGWFLAIVAVALFILIRRAMRSDIGRNRFEQLLLRSPAIGVIASRFALVRFTRMLGTLVGAGVPLVSSLRVAKEAIGYQTLTRTVDQAVTQVQQGEPLARSLADCPQLFPASVIEMVAVAEETGRMSEELVRMAGSYEAEVDRRLRLAVSLAEPVLLFLMAAIVGTIIVGMLLPVFTLQQYIQ